MLAVAPSSRPGPLRFHYYRAAGRDGCFPSALANCLLELHDGDAADRVYRRFWDHLLAHGRFCSLLLLSRYVADLTEGVYRGVLSLTISRAGVMHQLRAATHVKRGAVQREMASGSLRFERPIVPESPSVMIVAGRRSHALTYMGDDWYVDDGRVRRYPLLAARALGQLVIEPLASAR